MKQNFNVRELGEALERFMRKCVRIETDLRYYLAPIIFPPSDLPGMDNTYRSENDFHAAIISAGDLDCASISPFSQSIDGQAIHVVVGRAKVNAAV
jgi:hypothetical protein